MLVVISVSALAELVGILQAFEEGEQLVVGAVAAGFGRWRGDGVERALFDGHVGVQVDVGRADVGVAEPEGDDRGVDPGLQQRHGAAVAQHVGMKLVRPDRGTCLRGGDRVHADERVPPRRC